MSNDHRIKNITKELTRQFFEIGIDTAALDARWLIEAVSGVNQTTLILEPEIALTEDQFIRLQAMVERRKRFEPVAKILGEKEFYGRAFKVTKDVLDPRPDTETLIDVVLKSELEDTALRFLDVGVGSGAIAITLLCEKLNWQGVASDISDKALAIASENSETLGVADRLVFVKTSWMSGIDGLFDFIVSNPPYIGSAEIDELSQDVKNYDPVLALDGGDDGLEAYRQIALTSGALLKPQGKIYLEIGYTQASQVIDIFRSVGFLIPKTPDCITKDLGGNDRVITLMWDR